MAHRAIASTGHKDTENAAFASITAADIIRAPIVQRRIPVDFRPLLKPFKRAGRLCLRIERLPQGAKLSAGRRSTDNSWSLASDELEDLEYLVSSNVARDHELTIRVMTFEDGEASTLKVLQYQVSSEPLPSEDLVGVQPGREPHGDTVIRSQLSEMHSLFAVRESELVELRAALERAAGEKEAEIAKARSDWEQELVRKMAEAVEQSRLREKHTADSKEADRKEKAAHEERQAGKRVAAEREQAKLEFEQRSEAERRKWQADSEQRMEEARKQWQADAGRKMDVARKTWQDEQDARRKSELEKLEAEGEKRLEAERRKWRSQSDERSAKERERLGADVEQRIAAARQAWAAEADQRIGLERDTLAAENRKRIEVERESWLAQSRDQAAKERERWIAEADQRLETARADWTKDADERRRADLESWKADTERRLEGERQTWLAKGSEQDRAEYERLRAEIEARLSTERQAWQAEADEQFRKERQAWEADAGQRLEEARQDWQAKADSGLASERARLEAEVQSWIAAERQRLEQELAAAKMAAESSAASMVSAVPPAVADGDAIRELEDAREKNRQLNEALVAQADKARELEAALAAMAERGASVEQAPPAGEKPAPADPDDGYIRSLRAEVTSLRKSMANQAAELGRARAALEQARPLHVQRGTEGKSLGNIRDVFAEDEEDAGPSKKKALIRDCLLVAAVVIPLVVFYPWIAVYLPQPARDGIATATAGLLSVEEEKPPVPRPVKKAVPPPQVSRPTAIASRSLNVRATAELKGTVLFSLPKGTTVVLLENEGNWTRIEAPADAANKARQGWAWNAYLQDAGN